MSISVKLTKQGNSTGLRLPKEVMERAGLQRGDEVVLSVEGEGKLSIAKTDADFNATLDAYEECRARYGRALKILAQ